MNSASPDARIAATRETTTSTKSYLIDIGMEKASMAMKCIDQSNRSGGDQKNVQYEITRNQYENQSRLDLYRIIVSSQKCYTGLQIVF